MFCVNVKELDMSIIIYLFEFQLPMFSLNPKFLRRDCGTIPVAEITGLLTRGVFLNFFLPQPIIHIATIY
jgi:hypothetical protein